MRHCILLLLIVGLAAEDEVTVDLSEVELPGKIDELLGDYEADKREAAQEYREEVEKHKSKLLRRLEREQRGLDQLQLLALKAIVERIEQEGAVDIFGNPIRSTETWVAELVPESGSSLGWGELPDGSGGVSPAYRRLAKRDFYQVDGKPVEHGIMAHPPTQNQAILIYIVPGGVSSLSGAVAIDDVAKGLTRTPLIFRILVDGKELWQSKPIPRDGITQPFRVPVQPGAELRLIVGCPGHWHSALALWVDPKFE